MGLLMKETSFSLLQVSHRVLLHMLVFPCDFAQWLAGLGCPSGAPFPIQPELLVLVGLEGQGFFNAFLLMALSGPLYGLCLW